MQSAPSSSKHSHLKYFSIMALTIIIFASLFMFIASLVIESDYAYQQFQTNAFLSINAFFNNWSLFWLNITQLGDAAILIPLLSMSVIFLPKAWITLFVAAPLAGIVSYIGKKTLSMPRPAAVIDQSSFNIVGETLTGHNSLPSGHTITAFVAGTIIIGAFVAQKRGCTKNTIMFLVAGVITLAAGISRVAVGAHWPLDVLAGAMTGILLAMFSLFITTKYTRLWLWLENPKFSYIFAAILLLWSIILFKEIYVSNHEILIISIISPIAALLTSALLINQYLKYFMNKPSNRL